MACRFCGDTGYRWVDDGNGCVAKDPCDSCEVFNDRNTR